MFRVFTCVLIRFYFEGVLRVSCEIEVLGFRIQGFWFRVSCFGTKSRHPFGETDDIPNLIKHRPCAVKMNFPGQHTRPGRNIAYRYIVTYIGTYENLTVCNKL